MGAVGLAAQDDLPPRRIVQIAQAGGGILPQPEAVIPRVGAVSADARAVGQALHLPLGGKVRRIGIVSLRRGGRGHGGPVKVDSGSGSIRGSLFRGGHPGSGGICRGGRDGCSFLPRRAPRQGSGGDQQGHEKGGQGKGCPAAGFGAFHGGNLSFSFWNGSSVPGNFSKDVSIRPGFLPQHEKTARFPGKCRAIGRKVRVGLSGRVRGHPGAAGCRGRQAGAGCFPKGVRSFLRHRVHWGLRSPA